MRIALTLALVAAGLAGAAHAQGYRLMQARPGPGGQVQRPSYARPAAPGYGAPGSALALSRQPAQMRPGAIGPRPQGGVRAWGWRGDGGRYGERRVFRSYRPQVYAYASPGYSAYAGYGSGYFGSGYYGSGYYGPAYSASDGYAAPSYAAGGAYAYPQAGYGYDYGYGYGGGYAPAYPAQDYGYSAYGPSYGYGPRPPYASGGYGTGYAPVPPCACGY